MLVLQELPVLQRQHAAAEQALAQAQAAAQETEDLTPAVWPLWMTGWSREDYAGDERLKLAGIQRQMESTGYDRDARRRPSRLPAAGRRADAL